MYFVYMRAWTKVNLRRAAVEAGDSEVPEHVVEVGVVTVTEEWLRIGGKHLAVDVWDDSDLIIPAEGCQDSANCRVGKSCGDVLCPRLGAGSH